MKTASKFLGVMLALLLVAGPALAASEVGMGAPAKTLKDFEREYSGTKSIVAWNKFNEYQALKNAPQPTLAVSHMRISPSELKTLADYRAYYSGTKDIVVINKFFFKDRGITTSTGKQRSSKPVLKFTGWTAKGSKF